ncbi:hypothetical protein [Meiothermus sp. Pnk-1]|uniref:hypothetical protein n=1 Tax=Meiothermus sp. Pnk-1 TaxID=873128 RepID=UPI000D7C08B3|nr:hypothetical protein [Meiothermus sp. Pnk-1]PZA05982.1 hypothetical protein DNA98_15970 [Meiothermus sp. Pnk-1]
MILRKKLLALVGLAALFLAGCSSGLRDPLAEVPQAEEDFKAQLLPLFDEAEGLLGDLMPTRVGAQSTFPRSLTVASDDEGIVLITSPRSWTPPTSIEELNGKPLFIKIRCTSTGKCHVWLGELMSDGQQGYRMTWYGDKDSSGRRLRTTTEAQVEVGQSKPPIPPCKFYPCYSKKWVKFPNGQWGWVYDILIWPNNPTFIAHILAPFPSDLPGQPLQGTLNTDPLVGKLRGVVDNLRKPYEVEWPPAILLREDKALAFAPYKNPKLSQAQKPEELLNQDLGLLYLRLGDATRVLSLKLVQDGEEYFLAATDLKNPSQGARFKVGQVSMPCPPFECYAPSPLFLGIEDHLQASPTFQLGVGELLLDLIEIP